MTNNTRSYLYIAVAAIGLSLVAQMYASQRTSASEIARLTSLLNWKPGSTVADVGAGNGQFSQAIAHIVGPGGRVYATELDAKKRAKLATMAKQEDLANLIVIEGKASSANLPETCCDSIVLRRVYHHITDPVPFDASLRHSVRQGGRLAIIDFPPSLFLGLIAPVKGVPSDRGRHGILADIIVRGLTAAGFSLIEQMDKWPGGGYCLVFENRKK